MNETKDIIYSRMAQEYLKSADEVMVYIKKCKADTALRIKNPKRYNSRIATLRTIYGECISTAKILAQRAVRYKNG